MGLIDVGSPLSNNMMNVDKCINGVKATSRRTSRSALVLYLEESGTGERVLPLQEDLCECVTTVPSGVLGGRTSNISAIGL